MTQRPALLVVVSGAATDVGKTWVACELAKALRSRGLRVQARKPAQSFDPDDGATDAERLAGASGENATDVCLPHRWYPRAMAPPMAAQSLGLAGFDLADLVSELRWPREADVGIVELAGGLRSPQADDGDGVDFVDLVNPDVVVFVAGAGLGTLNDVRLAARALAAGVLETRSLLVYLNRFDPAEELHQRNREWLAQHEGLVVTVTPDQLADALTTSNSP
jgi:dethiobiotin synthetase